MNASQDGANNLGRASLASVLTICLLLAAALAVAQVHSTSLEVSPSGLSPASEIALANARVTIDRPDISLADAVQELERSLGVPVRADWRGLAEFEIQPAQTVNLVAFEASGHDALQTLFRQFSDTRLDYVILAGVVWIKTMAVIDSNMEVRYYPVHDLVNWSGTTSQQRLVDLADTQKREQYIEPEVAGEQMEALTARVQALMNLIRTVVEPDTWVENGGTGTISIFRGTLIVRCPPRVHRSLDRLLRDLRICE